jgi:hypothetical protein
MRRPTRRIQSTGKDHGCSVAEVCAHLDAHPLLIDRDKFLRHALVLELSKLDEMEDAFNDKAILSRNAAAAKILIKCFEWRAALLGLDPQAGACGGLA